MTAVVATLDDFGKPAWIAVVVLAFILFWPVGIAILAYLIWSGRMGCGRHGEMSRWQGRMADRWDRNMERWSREMRGFPSSGNAAFDDYRAEQLKRLDEERKRLDEEINAFHEHMRNLRMAKDREEFDRFMRDRNGNRGFGSGDSQNGNQN